MKLKDLQQLTTDAIIVYLNNNQTAYRWIYTPSLLCEDHKILNSEILLIKSTANDKLSVFIDYKGDM